MSNAKRYRRRHDDVQAFALALTRLLDVCQSGGGDPLGVFYPSWTPKPGREADAARLAAEVDRVAGRAAVALGHEFFIDWKPRGTMQTQRVNPAAGWRTILDSDPSFPVDAIFAVCNQAVGVLDLLATEAEEHEKSLAGKIERVIGVHRKPRRESVNGGHLRSAFIASIVSIPSLLVVAYLVFRFGWV
jgi:hypothetical protein